MRYWAKGLEGVKGMEIGWGDERKGVIRRMKRYYAKGLEGMRRMKIGWGDEWKGTKSLKQSGN